MRRRGKLREAAAGEARRSGVGENLEYRIRHKNGTWLVLESTSSVIGDASGVTRRLVIVNRDITVQNQASEALHYSRSQASFRD